MNCCERPKLSDLKLSGPDAGVFHRAQWAKLPAVVFITYRVVLALYLLAVYIAQLIQQLSPKSLVYLSNLAFIVFVAYVLVSGFVAVMDGCTLKKRDTKEMAIRHMIQWFLFNVTINVNFMVSIIYWVALFDASEGVGFYGFHIHAVTSIVSMADLLLTAVPVRLFHVVYPCVLLLSYMVMTIIYWGTGNGTVYPFLDYSNNPGVTAGALVGIFVAIFVMQGLIWAIYKLRVWLWLQCEGRESIIQPDHEQSGPEEGL